MLLTLMWMLATVRMGLFWYFINDVYIRHGATQADTFQEASDNYGSLRGLTIASVVLPQVNVLIAESVMVRPVIMLIVNVTFLSRSGDAGLYVHNPG